jgi:hypothetical protein
VVRILLLFFFAARLKNPSINKQHSFIHSFIYVSVYRISISDFNIYTSLSSTNNNQHHRSSNNRSNHYHRFVIPQKTKKKLSVFTSRMIVRVLIHNFFYCFICTFVYLIIEIEKIKFQSFFV